MRTVPIELHIVQAGDRQPAEQLERRCQQELMLMLQQLELPAHVVVTVAAAEAGSASDSGAASALRLSLNGQAIVLPARRLPGQTPEATVLCALHQHRSQLVTEDVVRALWSAWSSSGGVPPERFTKLLRALVEARIRVSRVANAVRRWDGESVEALFEEALGQTTRRVRIFASAELLAALAPSGIDGAPSLRAATEAVKAKAAQLADDLFQELGVRFGPCDVVETRGLVQPDELRVAINDTHGAPRAGLRSGQRLVDTTRDRLERLGVEARESFHPTTGRACAIVDAPHVERAVQIAQNSWSALDHLILTLADELRSHAPALLSLDLASYELLCIERRSPKLVALARARIGEGELTRVLRRLLEENVSIRNLRCILEALVSLAALPTPRLTTEDLVVHARSALKRQLVQQYARGSNTLCVLIPAAGLEGLLRLAAGELELQRAIDRIGHQAVAQAPPDRQPVVLTTRQVRRPLQLLLRRRFPEVAVLSYEELTSFINIRPTYTPDDSP
jgi:type III secretory pathway component EscV